MLNSRLIEPLGGRLKGIVSISRTVLLVCCALAACSALMAQGTADIVGSVTDNSGSVIPNAKVTVKNLGTSDTRTVQTTGVGEYSFTLLPVGTYSITVAA